MSTLVRYWFIALSLFIASGHTHSMESYIIGVTGTVEVEQPDANTWHTVNLSHTFYSPVVFMQVISHNNREPVHIRLTNVQSDSFQFKMEEWLYQNGYHGYETINYVVLESGTHTLHNGTIEVGRTIANHHFQTVFLNNMRPDPVVFTQAQSFYGSHPIVTRQRNVNFYSFGLKLQEEENQGPHYYEIVGYMALDNSIANNNGATVCHNFICAIYTQNLEAVTHFGATATNLLPFIGVPSLLANMQTYNGADTADTRLEYVPYSETAEVYIEEERSRDLETAHVGESVAAYLFESDGTNGNALYGFRE